MDKQIGIIPFCRDFLMEYTKMKPTPVEVAELVEMMRALEHGLKVCMVPTKHETHAVDTPMNLVRVGN